MKSDALVDTLTTVRDKVARLERLEQTGSVPSGATMPASPTAGDLFLHTPTGRKILYEYTGTAWAPIKLLSAATFYVSTTGTDNINYGWGTGADALASVDYVASLVPMWLDFDVTIILTAGTYDLATGGMTAFNGFSGAFITLQGEMSATLSDAATGGTQGSGATWGTVVKAAAGWVANAYQDLLVMMTSGVNTGEIKVILSNDATTLNIVGTWTGGAPAAGDTFDILDWATILNGSASTSSPIDVNDGSLVELYYLKFEDWNPTGSVIRLANRVRYNIYYCRVEPNSGNRYAIQANTSCSGLIQGCVLLGAAAGNGGVNVQVFSTMNIVNCQIKNTAGSGTRYGIQCTTNSYSSVAGGASNIEGYITGVLVSGALLSHNVGAGPGYSTIRNCTNGVSVEYNGYLDTVNNLQFVTVTNNYITASAFWDPGTGAFRVASGVAFPATQSPVADANTLDDYEEDAAGFTVTMTCFSGTITLNANTGAYTKIGREVFFTIYITVQSVSSPSGATYINGLPFTCANNAKFYSAVTIYADNLKATAVTVVEGYVMINSTSIALFRYAAGAIANIGADIKAGTVLMVSGHYVAA